MTAQIKLGDMAVAVAFKDIKNVHLSVHPPAGRVSISAPRHMKLETVRIFAISKFDWIKRQQKKIRSQERELEREFLDRETHFVWGRRCLLVIEESDDTYEVLHKHNRLILRVRTGIRRDRMQEMLDTWYREQVKATVQSLLSKWQPLLGVKASAVYVQRMKTRWGSCSTERRSIRLNSDLAKKPRECLEYIVVHELLHLHEPTHNARFIGLMDKYMPHWQESRSLLNRLPLRHERWNY